jgi:hypothetical protein
LRPCSGSWRISSPCPTQSTRTPPPTSVFVLRLLRPCPPPTSVLVPRPLASLSLPSPEYCHVRWLQTCPSL